MPSESATLDRTLASPLTMPQESLWCLNALAPESPIYNIPYAFKINGPVDEDRLERSFHAIIARQSALRSHVRIEQGGYYQMVKETVSFKIDKQDLSFLRTEREKREALQSAVDLEINQPFNLTGDLPLRALLLQTDLDERLLVITLHHLFTDHWSLHLLCRELSEFYRNGGSGNSASLPALEIEYHAWAAQQRSEIQRVEADGHLTFWKERLSGKLPKVDLLSDFPRPRENHFKGATLPLSWSAELTAKIKRFCENQGVSAFNLLLAAFNVLIFRHTGQEDLIIGAPIGQRDVPEVENLIGFFVQTLPFRIDLRGDPTFLEVINRTRDMIMDALDHQNVVIEKLIEELKPERESGRHPLHQILFQYLPSGDIELNLEGASIEAFPVFTRTSKFDLTFSLYTTNLGLKGEIEYRTDLFHRESIERMMEHFQILVESAIITPSQTISRLPILSEAETSKQLVKWNATETAYPRNSNIKELFESVVARNPKSVALVTDRKNLTYLELDQRANTLAREIIKIGAHPGEGVGIALARSVEMIVAILAAIKAGCYYVPLDPKYPTDRLASLVEESKLKLIVTNKASQGNLPLSERRLAMENVMFDAVATRLDDVELKPGSIAYVLFTSGSTGKPKAVAVPHRAVVRLVRNTTFADLGPEQVFLQFAPLGFDASTLEIWGPLLNGGRLVLAPADIASLDQLGGLIAESGVTTLWLTAGLFHYMVDNHLESLNGVRQLLAGGDVLSVQHVLKAQAGLPECRLINGYGPTENTTFTCCHTVPQGWPGARSVPIGKPISNTQVYLLDSHMKPVPIGIAGELYAGGDGVAAGYMNDPALTAEKFVPNPFSADPNATLYRTGDLARYLADGTIEFLGRRDQQVKVRGFRIELEEIEAALRQCDGVRDCVVAARPDGLGSNLLVGYVVPSADPMNHNSLRKSLEARVPSYMVPSKLIFLDALPVTANGKINRNALPEDDSTPDVAESKTTMGRILTATEEKLLKIWRELLKVEKIDADDNFFELGGHSLLAMRVVSRINKDFGARLTMRHLFDSPRVSSLALHLNVSVEAKRGNGPGPIKRRTGSEAIPPQIDSLSEREIDAMLREVGSNSPEQ